ncbi:hypothetical protein NPIL_381181 [Nephila pilipes]|uniref:Uncharacterized protein n=1 Tax=Nephila pilipes TaxID=299642 RepID=A0A8X6MER6_NEPPI|nr:hypothetical protein NPIL_381181 [Nephila pilipes]
MWAEVIASAMFTVWLCLVPVLLTVAPGPAAPTGASGVATDPIWGRDPLSLEALTWENLTQRPLNLSSPSSANSDQTEALWARYSY